ncbi:MAG TPA: (5-formylfuran-3-yl)methyl phosphate synthase [Gemmatimonadales bacterium]|nr:(5-formylfuran-3-yl)methyl phosphate synthase [Gemmatimonadales bacterium]
MQLLVSVADRRDAHAALEGGADLIDAKDPRRGALGAVRREVLAAIRGAIPAARPVSAALGDARDEPALARAARAAARLGIAFVKVGFGGGGGLVDEARARRLAVAARSGAGAGTAVVLVAYADWRRAESLAPERVVAVAEHARAAGVLLDTAFKDAPVFALASPESIGAWIGAAHAAGLFACLAGGLDGSDFATARALGADLVGVRGAACVGGRTGPVSRARVAALGALAHAMPRVRSPVFV